tara:strand:- start:175 stop:528 length:354 start_codon:yes stop_codon:yes gene_type:complete
MSNNDQLLPGELVSIQTLDLKYSDDGLALCGAPDNNSSEMKFFEQIDVTSYPSCSDFYGKSYSICHGEVALVSRYVGRPFRISKSNLQAKYDVYEVIVGKKSIQAFRQNLKRISTKD